MGRNFNITKQEVKDYHNKAMDLVMVVNIRRIRGELTECDARDMLLEAFYLERTVAMACFYCLDVSSSTREIVFESAANLAKQVGLLEEYIYLKHYTSNHIYEND